MEKLRAIYQYLRKKYEVLSAKKYTTIAGTLVFFLIMSIVPFSFWLTLLIGKLPLDANEILKLPVFESVKEVFLFVRKEATEATTGASVILMFSTLYSSTNLFYQMRRSGEFIYDFHKKRQGFRLRIGALVLLFIVMAAVLVGMSLFALGSFLFSRLLSNRWELVADYALLITISFFLVLLLNTYICPHREKIKAFLPGTILTVGLWIGSVMGFSLYLKISNMTRLYGALSAVIVFLLWLYVLMICFIVGVIFNSEKIVRKHKRK